MKTGKRSWDILLVGGASGTGKTRVAQQLSDAYGVGLVAVDDFQVMLEAMTTPQTLPTLHYWQTHPGWQAEGIDAAVGHLVDAGRALAPGLLAVIADRLAFDMPMILEGDFLLPSLYGAAGDPRVKAVFLLEDEAQILANYLGREPGAGEQRFRAAVSGAYSRWLAEACGRLGIPAVAARPWADVLPRVMAQLEGSTDQW